MLGVAARALLTGTGGNVVGGVQTFVGGKPGRNLGVTVVTIESRLPAKLVATGTIRGTVEGLMRAGQRAGRNLRRHRRQRRETQQEWNGIQTKMRSAQPKCLQAPAVCAL